MIDAPSPPDVSSPEKYQLDAQNFEEYWRAHAVGIRAAALALKNADNSQAVTTADQLVAYSLGEQAEKSELRADKERLVRLSNTDPLTGVCNRRGAEHAYGGLAGTNNQRERRQTPQLPVSAQALIIDVDDFKIVNDEHGHQAGDDLLIKMANIMTNNTRPNDVVARWGGDEFVVLLPRTPQHRAEEVAQVIRQQVEATTHATVSIGIGTIDYSKTLEQIVADADKALGEAKEAGKNIVVHFADLASE